MDISITEVVKPRPHLITAQGKVTKNPRSIHPATEEMTTTTTIIPDIRENAPIFLDSIQWIQMSFKQPQQFEIEERLFKMCFFVP